MILFLLVAACSGASRTPERSSDPDARRLQVIEDVGARACACADRACAEALDEELAKTVAATPAPRLFENEEIAPRVEKASHELMRCMWSRGHVAFGLAPMVVEGATAMKAKACSCEASGCQVEISREEYSRWLHLRAFPVAEANKEEVYELRKAADKCLARDRAPLPDSPIAELGVAAMEELREHVCACKDTTCIDALLPEYVVWIRHHGLIVPSPTQTERIKTATSDLSACIEAVEERQP